MIKNEQKFIAKKSRSSQLAASKYFKMKAFEDERILGGSKQFFSYTSF
jgi:hypothetical protein